AIQRTFGAASALLFEKASDREYRCTIAAPAETAAGAMLPAHGFLLHRLEHYAAALPLGAGDLETVARYAEAHAPALVAEVGTLTATRARLAVALRTSREVLGVLLLGPPADRDVYAAGERQALAFCADQFALMIENARLTARVVEQEKLRRDLALATEVQKRLLPERAPEREAAALSAVSLPARSVGGDYYDCLQLGHHRVGIALADVSGKGVPPA